MGHLTCLVQVTPRYLIFGASQSQTHKYVGGIAADKLVKSYE